MRLVDMLARMLDPEEREAVLGDLAESGETGVAAFCGLAGLVARRQAGLWKNWRPWVATAVMLPAAWYLSLAAWRVLAFSTLDWWIILNHKDLDPAVLAENGFSLQRAIWEIASGWVVMPVCAWVAGFLAGFLARRTNWTQAAIMGAFLFYPLRYPWWSPETIAILAMVALAPVLVGLRSGRRRAAA